MGRSPDLFAAPWVLLLLLALPLLPLGRCGSGEADRSRWWWWRWRNRSCPRPATDRPAGRRLRQRPRRRARGREAPRSRGWGGGPTVLLRRRRRRVSGLDAEVPPLVERGATDIARALQVAAAGDPDRIVLVSDGIESRGDLATALPARSRSTCSTCRPPPTRGSRAAGPDRAAPGATLEAVAVVELDRAAEVTLRPSVDGAR
jgi:hypothetical protein